MQLMFSWRKDKENTLKPWSFKKSNSIAFGLGHFAVTLYKGDLIDNIQSYSQYNVQHGLLSFGDYYAINIAKQEIKEKEKRKSEEEQESFVAKIVRPELLINCGFTKEVEPIVDEYGTTIGHTVTYFKRSIECPQIKLFVTPNRKLVAYQEEHFKFKGELRNLEDIAIMLRKGAIVKIEDVK